MSTILIVDDMAICREPIADALRRHGFDCLTAADGREALSLVRERRPRLILLDVLMPGLDGFAVLRTLRRNPDFKEIPVIMLTDKAEKEFVLHAAEHHIQGYLLKSQFSLDELLSRVRYCLEERHEGTKAQRHEDHTSERQTDGGAEGRRDGGAKEKSKDSRSEEGTGSLCPDHERSEGAADEPRLGLHKSTSKPRPSYAQWRAQEGSASGVATATAPTAAPSRHRVQSHEPPRPTGAAPRVPDDLQPLITKDDLIRLVNHGLELRPLGPAIHNVIAVTANPRCSAEEVARAVAHDQALCIRVLKLANSSAYSRGRLVESVREAVQRLGIDEVRTLVMTLGVFHEFEGAAAQHVDPRHFWEHSLACGLLASGIAKAREVPNVDDYFLWGMLHDVGRLVLLEHVSDQYAQVWDVAGEVELPLEVVEAKMMLLDHCDILARSLERWAFPRQFIAPVVSHHHSVERIKRLGPEYRDAAMTIALADRLAHALLLGSSGNDAIYPLNELVAELRMSRAQLDGVIANIAEEAEDLKLAILARGSEGTWPDFASQLRDSSLAGVRPLHASCDPATDAFQMLFECLNPPGTDEAPNLGILYLRNASDLPAVIDRYRDAMRRSNAPELPVLVICDKGKLDHDDPWLRDRPHAVLRTPVPISRLQHAIEGLTAEQPIR